MKRKILAALASAMLATALIPRGMQAQERSIVQHETQIRFVLDRVRAAFTEREACRNLFSKYRAEANSVLQGATFRYVGDALTPMGFAAATAVGTNQTFIGVGFYQNTNDLEGMATVLIHELLHQSGAGQEIDNYIENYAQISAACGTRNAAR